MQWKHGLFTDHGLVNMLRCHVSITSLVSACHCCSPLFVLLKVLVTKTDQVFFCKKITLLCWYYECFGILVCPSYLTQGIIMLFSEVWMINQVCWFYWTPKCNPAKWSHHEVILKKQLMFNELGYQPLTTDSYLALMLLF